MYSIKLIAKYDEYNKRGFYEYFGIKTINELENIDETIKAVQEVKPDCEQRDDYLADYVFYRLFDADNKIIDNVAIERSEFFRIDHKNFRSNLEVYLLEYDFFEKKFVIACNSLNFVRSDFNDFTKDEAIEKVREDIIDYSGIFDFDDDFIKTFFDDLE